MDISDLMTAQFFAQLLLALVVAMLAFAAGFRFALVMQRRDFRRSGYTMIGCELYRATLIRNPRHTETAHDHEEAEYGNSQ